MITRLRYPKGYQFFDANGAPIALGNLYYYAAGTTTPLDTYTDSAGAIPNSNPIVLDASGRLGVDVYLGSTSNYKEVLATASTTVAPWPDDNIPLASQPDWNATSGPSQILNKPALAAVAASGSYTDLSNVPPTQSPFTGDSGSGGAEGLVPAPAAGDALANKFLSASGAWKTPPGAAVSINLATSVATASGSTLTFASVPSSIAAGMLVTDSTTPSVIPAGTTVTSTTSTTVTLSAAVTGSGVANGDTVNFYGAAGAATNLSVSETANAVSIGSSSGSGVTISAATDTTAGVLDAARAAKIDGLAASATTDTTNASNITAGTLAAARIADLSATYLTATAAASQYAPVNSPALTGTPTAPTPAAGNNSTAIATTAYLDRQLGANNGIATLDGTGKLPASQIPASLVGAAVFQGTWNAATNTPALASGVGAKGNYYKVSVAGATAIDGNSQWAAGDTIIFDGVTWDKINGAQPEVLNVAGLSGAVSASALSSALGLGSLAGLNSVGVSNINASGTPSANTYLRGDNTWGTPSAGSGAPGGSNGQFQYNNAGAFAGLSTHTTVGTSPVLAMFGDGTSAPSRNALVVNNYPNGSLSRQFVLANGNWWSTAVPFLQPYTDNTGIALDIMPKGATVASGGADCWIDICSTDVVADGANWEALGFWKHANGNGAIACHATGTGVVRDLLLQDHGGGVSIGSALPKSKLDVAGGVAIGSYAGGNAAPANGLIVSGITGIGTASPAAQLHLSGSLSAAAWTSNAIGLRIDPGIYTDTSSAGTVGYNYVHRIWQPVLAASSATTYTTAATFVIGYAPAAGTNVTITNPLAFYVPNGASCFGGNVGFGGVINPQFSIDANGVIAAGNGAGNGELRSYQTAGSTYISLKTDGTAHKSGLYRSVDANDFFIYFATSGGDTVVNSAYGNANIRFTYLNTEYGRMNSSGNWGIGTGYGASAPTVPLDVNGAIRTRAVTVASLPSASTAGLGARHFVTDATQTFAAGMGATVAGGGANKVPVYSDGASWIIG